MAFEIAVVVGFVVVIALQVVGLVFRQDVVVEVLEEGKGDGEAVELEKKRLHQQERLRKVIETEATRR